MKYTKLIWRDQQPYSEMFDDIYYSSDEDETVSGESEFEHVFFRHNGLPERWKEALSENSSFVIAELGFGSGLNCILTIKKWLEFIAGSDDGHQDRCLHYIAIEKYPLSPQTLGELASQNIGADPELPTDSPPEVPTDLRSIADELIDNYPPAVETTHIRRLFGGRVVIHYRFMDALQALAGAELNVDAWYLDGFSPAQNPEMWSEELFQRIAENSRSGTTCSTYTAAGFVRRNMQAAGFEVSKVAGHGKKREMLVAVMAAEKTSTTLKFKDRPWFASAPAISRDIIRRQKTATIIGAGIAGLSVAYALVQRGWKVSVIDKHGDVAKGTSENPAAIVYPRLSADNDTDTAFYVQAYAYSLYLLKKLQEKHAEKFWFDNGMLQRFDKKRIAKIVDRFGFNDDFISVLNKRAEQPEAGPDNVYAEYGNTGVVLPP
ncbi:MAG: tRNA (5-methylaminomethyl-2-thiouridine)(34)-methyltransferase MnmD, partial [Proteobacteria bacterium]|nr:tRNA (5-methylaminomethyl-2-thiouridine)(34)-methyltransferase MnmD [Pseudomonadota bacterium]